MSTTISTESRRLRDSGLNERLAAVVLLAGAVRQTELARAAGRSRVDLPITSGLTLGDCWSERVDELRVAIDSPELPMIVAANTTAGPSPNAASWRKAVVRMDFEEPRGSGGALRDAVQHLDPELYVLVVPGYSYPREPLGGILGRLTQLEADVVVHVDRDDAPTGIFLIRCGSLASLPSKGFVDLKEQALPQIASRAEVRVARTEHVATMPIRTLDGYIAALRVAAGANAPSYDADVEEWRSTFALAERGSEVHSSARLHDSIVLAGGRVGEGAIVVRSLVGPGGVIGGGQSIFDELVVSGTRST